MGTRNLTAVILNGEVKVAQYGQWDGYPTGQGYTCSLFIRDKLMTVEGLEKFKKAVSECTFVDDKNYRELWAEVGVPADRNHATSDEAEQFHAKNPQFSRDHGAGVLGLILDNGARKLKNSWDFAADSLFCEWAYVFDLDNQVLEVYKGFNKSPVPEGERFASMPKDGEYYPVRLIKKYAFSELTEHTMEGLSKELSKDEED